MSRAPWLAVALAGLCPAAASAQVVVPNAYENLNGLGVSSMPIDIQGNPRTLQLVISASQLTNLVGMDLTGISYRRGATAGGSYPLQQTTWSDYVIRLGPSVAPSAATGSFPGNFTAAPTEVRSGPWTVPFFAWPNNGPPGPNPWGPEATFDTPYLYTGGNLAVLITHPGSDNPNIGNALMDTTTHNSPGFGTDYSFFYDFSFDAASGSPTEFMPIVRFSAVTPTPEPSGWLTGAAALAAAVAAARRRRPGR
jgi:MYXO-CTERM domain-containing protein